MAKDWSTFQEEIRQLYHVENKPLNEVMRLIKGRHGFHARERSYRNQLKKWGYSKYSTESCPRPPGRRKRGGSSTARPMADRAGSVTTVPRQHSSTNREDVENLCIAIQTKDWPSIKTLLNSGTPVNSLDGRGRRPLSHAVERKDFHITQYLIRFGADVNATDVNQRSVLHLIAQSTAYYPQHGRPWAEHERSPEALEEIIHTLLANGIDLSAQDVDGNTPLHLAIMNPEIMSEGYSEVPRNFIFILLQYKPDVNIRNNHGISPLELLIRQERSFSTLLCVERLLDAGADISRPASNGNMLFHDFLSTSTSEPLAVEISHGIISQFLQRGADPYTTLPSGHPIIRELLRPDSGFTFEHVESVLDIVRGLNLRTVRSDGNSVAHDLCALLQRHRNDDHTPTAQGIRNITDTIIETTTDLNCRNDEGKTPLLVLVSVKTHVEPLSEAAISLLKAGADPWAQDDAGHYPLLEIARWKPKRPDPEVFIRAHLTWRDRKGVDSPKEAPRGKCLDWKDWELAAEAPDWDTARQIFFNPRSHIDADVDYKLRKSALSALVEKHVGLVERAAAEAGSSVARREALRGELKNILRDYRTIGREIPPSWVDKLLDLC